MPLPEVPAAPQGWLTIEVDQQRLTENMRVFRGLVGDACRLMAVVKADAYGHGLLLAAEAFLAGGADVLGVHSLAEAQALRRGGFENPVLILGPVLGHEALDAARLGAEITVASMDAARQLGPLAGRLERDLPVHLKVETGVNRQGVTEDEMGEVLELLGQVPEVRLVGLSSHFADIEDTTDHGFAHQQMKRFTAYQEALAARGVGALCRHMTCSAATLLWERSHWEMARVGISAYGLWPSRETLVSVRQKNRPEVDLRPALTWKVRVSPGAPRDGGADRGLRPHLEGHDRQPHRRVARGLQRRLAPGSFRPRTRAVAGQAGSSGWPHLHEPVHGGRDPRSRRAGR